MLSTLTKPIRKAPYCLLFTDEATGAQSGEAIFQSHSQKGAKAKS